MKHFNPGFTLMELLIVIAIMGLLGLVFTDTILQSLRGQTKVKVINQVKQNGQLILDSLANEARSANSIICLGDTSPPDGILDTVAFKKDETLKRFRFYPPQEAVKVNGYIARYDFTKDAIADGFSLNEICTDANFGKLQESRMSDGDPVNGVSLDAAGSDHIFSRSTPKPGFGDVVKIRFSANSGVSIGQSVESRVEEGGVVFETSVQIRGTANGF